MTDAKPVHVAPDDHERFYEGSTGECSACGSYGSLYHFNGRASLCPFCVIADARTNPPNPGPSDE